MNKSSPSQERIDKMQVVSDSCAKIRNLGFKASMNVSMYGERFEIVSDPFDEAGGVAVRATCGTNPEIRTLRLRIAILLGHGLNKEKQQ